MNLAYQPISPYLEQLVGRHRAEGHAQGHQEGRREGHQEGRAEGMVRMLERLLEQRGLEPSVEQHRRVTACTDEEQLQRWFDRALTATCIAEVFEG